MQASRGSSFVSAIQRRYAQRVVTLRHSSASLRFHSSSGGSIKKELSVVNEAENKKELDAVEMWEKKKAEDSEVREYATGMDWVTPRTLSDLKHWDLRQQSLEQFKAQRKRRKIASEELRDVDLLRSGHIMQAMKVGSANDDLATASEKERALQWAAAREKMDFSAEPTYVDEGVTELRYATHKYLRYFAQSFTTLSLASTALIAVGIAQNWLSPDLIADAYAHWNPGSVKPLVMVSAQSAFDVWCVCLNVCTLPMVVLSAIYAKAKGEIWEFALLSSADFADKKDEIQVISTLPAKRRRNHENQLIYEIQVIRERRKKRKKLASALQVVDVFATFSPISRERRAMQDSATGVSVSPKAIAHKAMKLRKMALKYGALKAVSHYWALGHRDPRRLAATEKYGLLHLQTRLDEFGRAIPGWQRERVTRMILPCFAVFFVCPSLGDWLFAWG